MQTYPSLLSSLGMTSALFTAIRKAFILLYHIVQACLVRLRGTRELSGRGGAMFGYMHKIGKMA